MQLQHYTGPRIAEVLDDLARLRVAVFREFPYLYQGTPEYEADYLSPYLRTPDSLAVLVRDGQRVVGATTALPLESEAEEFQRPFREHGYDAARVFYLAESVLLPEYRGRGLGVAFFQEREAHARRLGRFDTAAFCAVQRPADHPRRPADYTPLDAFWRKRGYEQHPELRTSFTWQDLDEAEATPKPMTFWLKPLQNA